MRGWVYILSNKAMPGLLKVGFTLKDPTLRARELEQTGVPHPFAVDYEVMVNDPRRLEQQIHLRLAHARERKEWFRCELAEAVEAIRELVGANAILENLFKEKVTDEPHLAPADLFTVASESERNVIGGELPKHHGSTPCSTRSAAPVPDRIRFAAQFSGPCQYCGVPFKVTVTRHESGTVCPWCHRYNDLAAFVSQELPW
jgi:hypothetical protein